MTDDELYRSWMADMNAIRIDVHELFSLRRTFRDIAEVFRKNPRLQDAGGHIWNWMRLNYAASVLMRLRRQVDSQRNTVNLKQLLHALIRRPDVVTRGRRNAIFARGGESEFLVRILHEEFSRAWVDTPDLEHPDDDHINPVIVRDDLAELERAVRAAAAVADRAIAHRQRISPPGVVTMRELDEAFDAIERTLQKYYALICGASLVGAEPAPQFDTHEVFTFPWIAPSDETE